MALVWFETYRPKKFEEVIGLPVQFKSMVNEPTHLLLVGGAGCGKTTSARILADEMNAEIYELNASDDRGIQVIRDKVKFYAQKMSIDRKVMFLDEADGLTIDAQQSLRRIMEQYSSNTIFILTANYLRRIIEPIRSRCAIIEFPAPEKKDIIERLKFICTNEHISYEKDDLVEIVNRSYPDIRHAINMLQSSSYEGKVHLENIEVVDDILEMIYDLIKQENFVLLREVLGKYVPNYDRIYRFLYEKVFESDLSDGEKKEVLLEIAERMWRNQSVSDPEINFIAGMYKISSILGD